MGSEIIFRASSAIISTLLACIRFYYGWQAGKSNEKVSTRRAGSFSLPLIWFFGLLGAITSILYVIDPNWLKWARFSLPAWLRWSGVGLGAVIVLLFRWVHQALGQNWSMPLVIKKNQTLVTTGPYRWVRHPMYSTLFGWVLAYFLISANWFIGAVWLGLALMAAIIAEAEEVLLTEKFGEAYRAYRRRTGRFLPRLKR